MGLSDTKSCSLCKSSDETIIHLFQNCRIVKTLWNELSNFLLPNLTLPPLTPESAILGFYRNQDNLINHIHLIFKIAIYKSRITGTCSLDYIKHRLKSIKLIEDNLTFLNDNQKRFNEKKWAKISNKVS